MISESQTELLLAAATELELLATNRTQTPDLAAITQAMEELGQAMSNREYSQPLPGREVSRLASKQAEMRRRSATPSEPISCGSAPVHYWSPAELAAAWSLSVDTVRRLFEREPGVLLIGSARYRTLRIPQEVVERVRRKREIVC
jgi:hypothetical protein